MSYVEWKPVRGFESRYEVSSDGRVRSLRGNRYLPPGEIYQHKAKRNPLGTTYLQVTLWNGSRPKSVRVHRLVLDAFFGARPRGMVACHCNGDSLDNRVENLRWDTQKANIADSVRIGSRPKGERHGMAKLSEEAVREIRRSALSAVRLSKVYGVSDVLIGRVRNRRNWRHVE